MGVQIKTVVFVVAVLAVVAGAYYEIQVKQNFGNSLLPPENTGNLDFYVYDAPAYNVSAVYMTFSVISLYQNFVGWTTYTLGKKTIDVANIGASNASLLTGLALSPKNYTAVGLYVTHVVVNINGANETFTLASKRAFVSHSFSVIEKKTTNVNIQFYLGSDLNLNRMVFTPNIGSSFTAGNSSTVEKGTVNFYTYDRPSYNVSAVYLTFANISLHGVQTGWTTYNVTNQTINIWNRSAANAPLLNSITLAPQQYTMIRLYIENVTATVNGVNETFRIAAPYAIINQPFNVSANGSTTIKIQFDLITDLNVEGDLFTPLIGSTVSYS